MSGSSSFAPPHSYHNYRHAHAEYHPDPKRYHTAHPKPLLFYLRGIFTISPYHFAPRNPSVIRLQLCRSPSPVFVCVKKELFFAALPPISSPTQRQKYKILLPFFCQYFCRSNVLYFLLFLLKKKEIYINKWLKWRVAKEQKKNRPKLFTWADYL